MCGIFGVRLSWLERQPGSPQQRLEGALAALRWRGEDGQQIVVRGDFALGCARLAITDPRSRQPVAIRGGRFAGALNGAVTNARDLWRRTLQWRPKDRRLPNDAWLPLCLWAQRGDEGLELLRGHHAGVVVDAQRDQWRVHRDGMGEKPLFVLKAAGQLVACASTLPALAALGAPVDLGPEAIERFFRHGATGLDAFAQGDLQVAEAEAWPKPVSAPAGDFASAFRAAVARCADCEPGLGLFLSGGKDSSCLAAELQAQGRRVPAFQFAAADEAVGDTAIPQSDGAERAVAAQVAAHCGHEFVRVDAGPEVLDALPQLTERWGLPLGDPSVLAVHAVALAARQRGVRVLLSGEGADELMFGYQRHRALLQLPPLRLPWLPTPRWGMGKLARLSRAMAEADPYASLLSATPPAFLAQALRLPGAGQLPGGPVGRGPRWQRLLRAALVDREFYLRADLLPKLDVATMAAQVEGRCPFLDQEVVAALEALPPAQRLGKRPLQQAYAAALPPAVFAQPKRGFALPLDRWFRGPLPMLDLLRDRRTLQRPHIRPQGLARAIDLHRQGACDLGRALYLVGAYETWLRVRERACA